ncbi:Hypothetical_protein [Hexamita inflata]|uniref:Hypothetical_protein n=1 Tax=Hexamita inflata TaxID=28002 RepID=A0ABP1HRJ3_9EUKA
MNQMLRNQICETYLPNQISIQNNSLAAKSTATVNNVDVNRDGFLANSSAVFLEIEIEIRFCFSNLQSIPNQMLFFTNALYVPKAIKLNGLALFQIVQNWNNSISLGCGNSHIGCKRVALISAFGVYTAFLDKSVN